MKQLGRNRDGITQLPSSAEGAAPRPVARRRQASRRRPPAGPAMARDVWVYRIVVSAFAAVLLIASLGALLLPLSALLSFLIVAAVVYYFVVVPVNALMDRFKPEESIELRKRDCPRCLSKIPYLAERCAFCTADIGPAAVPEGVRAAI